MPSHDSSYKYLFSHARMVEDILRGFVREEWVEQLDFSTLEKVNGSYVSDDLRDRADDVVWRVRWGTDWLYVYILLEFQSTVDPWMAVRMMTYVGLLYQDLIQSGQTTTGMGLPPVLPIVLYNGERKWTAATNIIELINEVRGGLQKYQPRHKYLLLSEREYSNEDLEGLNNLVAALFRLENSRNPEELLSVVTALLKWLGNPEQASLRRAFTVWFKRVLFPSNMGYSDEPSIEELEEVKTMLAERVKEWNRNSFERGVQEGMQKGMQKGMHEGAFELLSRLLEKKFGYVPKDVKKLMANADEKQLFEWSERILTANTIGEIFDN